MVENLATIEHYEVSGGKPFLNLLFRFARVALFVITELKAQSKRLQKLRVPISSYLYRLVDADKPIDAVWVD